MSCNVCAPSTACSNANCSPSSLLPGAKRSQSKKGAVPPGQTRAVTATGEVLLDLEVDGVRCRLTRGTGRGRDQCAG